MSLSQSEEKLMQYLWKRKKAYLKDLLKDFPEPRPAKTTVATMLRRMIHKGFVSFNEDSSAREYYPLVKKSAYSSNRVNKLIKSFFNDSTAQLASYCTTKSNMTMDELEELKGLIDLQIQKRNK